MSKTVLKAGVSVTVDAPASPSSEAQAVGEKIGAQATEAMNDIDSLPEAPPEEPCIPCLIGAAVKGFVKGFVSGLLMGLAAGFAIAAVAAFSPVAAVVLGVGLAVWGAVSLYQHVSQLSRNWSSMTTEQKVGSVSEVVGNLAGGAVGGGAGYRGGGKVFGPPGLRAPGAGNLSGGGKPGSPPPSSHKPQTGAKKPVGQRRKNWLPDGKSENGPKNGVLERRNPQTGELQQRRYYDQNGKPAKDVDFGHDHGAGDPHVHDWSYPSPKAPNKVRGDGRPPYPGELD